jgi:hypothetical protein
LYLYFSGLTGKNKYSDPDLCLKIGKEPLPVPTGNRDFVYICDAKEIPGSIKVRDFISFICGSTGMPGGEKGNVLNSLGKDTPVDEYFRELEPHQRADALQSVIPYLPGSVFVVADMCRYLPLEITLKLKDQLDKLVKRGTLVIYLAKENAIDPAHREPERDVFNLPEWFDVVEAHRKHLSFFVEDKKKKK